MQKQILAVIASLVLLSGCGGKDEEVSTLVATTAPEAAAGEKAYKSTCSICHKSGLGGAPRMDNKKEWDSRIAQGNEILYDRAINGYRGSKGFMPPRGANIKLSESEVKAAVDYMVAHTMQAGY